MTIENDAICACVQSERPDTELQNLDVFFF